MGNPELPHNWQHANSICLRPFGETALAGPENLSEEQAGRDGASELIMSPLHQPRDKAVGSSNFARVVTQVLARQACLGNEAGLVEMHYTCDLDIGRSPFQFVQNSELQGF